MYDESGTINYNRIRWAQTRLINGNVYSNALM